MWLHNPGNFEGSSLPSFRSFSLPTVPTHVQTVLVYTRSKKNLRRNIHLHNEWGFQRDIFTTNPMFSMHWLSNGEGERFQWKHKPLYRSTHRQNHVSLCINLMRRTRSKKSIDVTHTEKGCPDL